MKLLLIFTCFVLVSCDNGPEVQITNGILKGKYMWSRLGRKFSGFLAIPYAKPPVGDRRFKDPEPNDPWKGVRSAVEDSPVCPQRNPYTRSKIIEGDEDCLYLNVYTPQLPSYGSDPLPVMVFLHGGGWVCGGGTSQWYGPDILLDRDVVLVVPNFRLGPLGFLSTQDDVVPGNMGLKDQVLALKWIQDNIAQFGGDPKKVTVFGESAGGASVQYHMLSPMSKGLIHAGIAQSGVALCPWAFAVEGEPKLNTKKLAKAFDCPTSTSEEMVECLQKVEARDIIAQDYIFWTWDYDAMIPFKPMAEHQHPGAFLTEHPRKLISEGKMADIPFITGITASEGALRMAGIIGNVELVDEFNKYYEKILPISLFYSETSPDVRLVTKKLKQFYFGDKQLSNETAQSAVDLYTDGWFAVAADEAVKLQRKHFKSPIYYYYLNHRGVASFSAVFGDPHRDYGVCHADDLQYLFPVIDGLFPDKKATESDKRVSEILTNMWVNFARTGNPSVNSDDLSISWKPVTTDNVEYLHINSESDISMRKQLANKRIEFWNSLPIISKEYTNRIQDEL